MNNAHEYLMQHWIHYNKTDVNLHIFYAALISRKLLSRVRHWFILVTQVYSESACLLACRPNFDMRTELKFSWISLSFSIICLQQHATSFRSNNVAAWVKFLCEC